MKRILVIKLGALGDFIMAQPAFRAIRAHHAQDKVALLTIPNLVDLARRCELFDTVIEDPRARPPFGYWQIVQRLRQARFDFVYDLQGNRRTAWYWRLLWPARPAWAGPVGGCSHPRPPRPPHAHRMDWYRAQLSALGLAVPDSVDLEWLFEDLEPLRIPGRYALFVAGGSAHRPDKRWPPKHYAEIAQHLVERKITPVLIGTQVDMEANRQIRAYVPQVLDLTARTSIAQIASLARRAIAALGNDTGPMHVIAGTGTPSVVLFSKASEPGFIGPRGPRVQCLQSAHLNDLEPVTVMTAITQCADLAL